MKGAVMIKRFAALLLLAVLAASGVAGTADAHRKKGKGKVTVGVSNITIDFTDQEPTIPLPVVFSDPTDYFSGRISKVKGCDGRHVISVFNANGQQTIGSAEAASTGDWVLNFEDPGEETFFARVVGFPKKDSHHVCARGTSSLITADDSDPF